MHVLIEDLELHNDKYHPGHMLSLKKKRLWFKEFYG